MKTLINKLTIGISAIAMTTTLAFAEFPERPISAMVSYGAGGATDFQARIVTMMSGNEDYLGQPIVIVNKPGAGGRVGWNWLATEAEKDGYTMGVYNIPHFIAQGVKGGVEYTAESFEPIANWGEDPAVVIVGPDSEFNTMEELVAFAKANPGRVTTSGAGLFVGHHIAALQIEKACDCKIAYIPNKDGGTAALKSVMAGEVMAGINNLSDAYRARQAGNVKILGIADLKRNEAFLPDVPTLMEAGLDVDNSSVNYRGLMVPKGTPQEAIDKLAERVPMMFKDRRVEGQMTAGGSPINIMTREEVQKMWSDREAYLKELLAGL